MAMRIRRVDGVVIAVCAALTEPKVGDLYIDDEAHSALSLKVMWERGEISDAHPAAVLMDREQGHRNAEEELLAWLGARTDLTGDET